MDLHVLGVIAVVGLLAGLINGVVGGASLMTFPVLVATGLHPVSAVITNTLGMGGGNLFAVIPSLRTRRPLLKRWLPAAAYTAFGAIVGGVLLFASPARLFEAIVPVLVAFATITMLLPRPAFEPLGTGHPHTHLRLWGSGVYCGYFGSGMGVISIAILARDGRLDMREVAVVKNLVIAAANTAVSIFFLFTGHADFLRAAVLFVSSATGGYLSGSVIDRTNPDLLRWLVVLIGAGASVYLTLRLFQ